LFKKHLLNVSKAQDINKSLKAN